MPMLNKAFCTPVEGEYHPAMSDDWSMLCDGLALAERVLLAEDRVNARENHQPAIQRPYPPMRRIGMDLPSRMTARDGFRIVE